MKSHAVLTHRMSMLTGAWSFGTHANDCGVNGVPHHGHALSGAGARLSWPVRYRRTRPTAVVWSASPVRPSRLGDASEPTHRPISIRQSPSSDRPLPSTFCGSVRI